MKDNRINVAIIIMLTGVLCLFAGYVMFDKMMSVRSSSGSDVSDNKLSGNKSSGNSSMSFDDLMELKSIIGATTYDNDSLNFILSKDSLNDITNNEKLFYASYQMDDKNRESGFSKEDLKNAYNKSALSNLEYTDDTINENGEQVYTYDNGAYKFDPRPSAEKYVSTRAVYAYDSDYYVKGNKYVVVNKYLFANSYEFDKMANLSLDDYLKNGGTVLYGSFSKAEEGAKNLDKGYDGVGKLGYYWTDHVAILNSFAMKNYGSIKDKLDTYTFTFEKKDGHFVLTDYSVKHA